MILYVNPKKKKSDVPCIDELSLKMKDLIQRAIQQYNRDCSDPFDSAKNGQKTLWGVASKSGFEHGVATMGVHECSCGERSASFDIFLLNGYMTNTLAEHYLAWHREEIPLAEIKKIRKMLAKE